MASPELVSFLHAKLAQELKAYPRRHVLVRAVYETIHRNPYWHRSLPYDLLRDDRMRGRWYERYRHYVDDKYNLDDQHDLNDKHHFHDEHHKHNFDDQHNQHGIDIRLDDDGRYDGNRRRSSRKRHSLFSKRRHYRHRLADGSERF